MAKGIEIVFIREENTDAHLIEVGLCLISLYIDLVEVVVVNQENKLRVLESNGRVDH